MTSHVHPRRSDDRWKDQVTISSNWLTSDFITVFWPTSDIFKWLNLTETVERHIMTNFYAYNQVSITFNLKILAVQLHISKTADFRHFRQFPAANLAETPKRHIYTYHLSLQPSLYDLPFKSSSSYFGKPQFLRHFCQIRSTSGGQIWPKLSKGTSIYQDFSFESITSLHDLPFKSSSPNKFIFDQKALWPSVQKF